MITDGTDLCLHCGQIKPYRHLEQCERIPCSHKDLDNVRAVIQGFIDQHGPQVVSQRCHDLLASGDGW
jgi:hypothetical protein